MCVCVCGGGGLETRVLHRLHISFLFSLNVHDSLGACKAAIWYTQMCSDRLGVAGSSYKSKYPKITKY